METIDIGIPWGDIERRQARVAAACQFRYGDRVPVVPGIASRYWLHEFGTTWAEYTSGPRVMVETQLRAHKWVLEKLDCDLTGVGIAPELFSFYGESYALGCDLSCDELTPWIASHPIQGEADLRRLERVDMADNRYTAAMDRWIAAMESLLDGYRLRYADGVIRLLPSKLRYPGGSIGIFTLAADLRGPDLYADLYERPAFVHELLSIVTAKVIARYRWLRSMDINQDGVYLVDDSSGALSPACYRKFVLPCILRAVEALGRPLTIHIDAPANHLLPIYRDELQIQRLDGFGWGTSVEKVREYLGGRAILTGNIEPSLFVSGNAEEVYRASRHALEVLAPCGGFMLMEGANMPPGASPESINAMTCAARDYGLPRAA